MSLVIEHFGHVNSSLKEISKELQVSLCKVTRGSKILKNKKSVITKYLKGENKNNGSK